MAFITVGAVVFPNPTKYDVRKSDITANESISESGISLFETIRYGVYTIPATFIVTRTVLKTMTDALAAATFSVTFFDSTSSADTTETMRIDGEKNCGLIQRTGTDANSLWEFSFTLKSV